MKAILFAMIMVSLTSSNAMASKLHNSDLIPHVRKKARDSYISFLYADEHRAFAVGTGGAWAWKSALDSPEQARKAAISACQKYTDQTCIPYAVNTSLVFNKLNWVSLWGPYKKPSQVAQSPFGNKRGQRFFNLKFKNALGNKIVLSDLLGKVVFVHFWGSWCPACMNEYPSLYRMRKILKEKMADDVELIILQVREPYEKSVRWVGKNRYTDMPLYDSGVISEEDSQFTLANGKKLMIERFPDDFPAALSWIEMALLSLLTQDPS